jgi:hypothetical protein
VQIQAWLSSLSSHPKKSEIMKKIKQYVDKTNNLKGESTICVACKKPIASLCPYCFTEHVFNLLKDLRVNRIVLKEFLQFFNYDFEHTGYTEDAERMGL